MKLLIILILIFSYSTLLSCKNDTNDLYDKPISELTLQEIYELSKEVQESSDERRQEILDAPPPPPLNILKMPRISMTTADEDPHIIKLQFSLGYKPKPELQNELLKIKDKDQMQNIVKTILKDKKAEELRSVESLILLSEEIKSQTNKILETGQIKEVYVTEFTVSE